MAKKKMDSDISELVNEVSIIEGKLGEAIAIIESAGAKDGDSE
jgi:hypothetical protein